MRIYHANESGPVMRHSHSITMVLFLIVAGQNAELVHGAEHQTVATSQPIEGCSSPQELYSSLRDAHDRGDWQTVFRCISPANRDEAVLCTYRECCFNELSPRSLVRQIRAKYGLTGDQIENKYRTMYRKKHGTDDSYREVRPREAKVGEVIPYEAKGYALPPTRAISQNPEPPIDRKLYDEVILLLIADRAGFYAEANRAMMPAPTERERWGTLENIVVVGGSATGEAQVTTYIRSTTSDKKHFPNEAVTSREKFSFRNVNGRWFTGK